MKCRFCDHELHHVFIDLVNSPPANSLLTKEQLNEPETFFPLKIFVCHNCFLVQIEEHKSASEIFDGEYVYFSSYSTSWLAHAKRYADAMTPRFGLNEQSLVIEIASNDGYLLQYFKEKNIPVLGIEPTTNTAAVAREIGIETVTDFFYTDFAQNELASKNRQADLLLGNNVLAHVPNIRDFVKGLKVALKPQGIITMEFPHLYQLIAQNQFDTIYHEHYSYLSFTTVSRIFRHFGLEMFDVEELPTHGGSLRIFAKHSEDQSKPIETRVGQLLKKEEEAGITTLDYYKNFSEKANAVKYNLLEFLIAQKRAGKKVIGYGAAAKGATLLNYCGVKSDLLAFIVDASPHKQNKYMAASHIPIVDKAEIEKYKPDYILILPWNLKTEIMTQLNYARDWGGKFVVPIPKLEVC